MDNPNLTSEQNERAERKFAEPATESAELLNDFVGYCKAHPTERFWQAIRNWSGHNFILASSAKDAGMIGVASDTFYWKSKAQG